MGHGIVVRLNANSFVGPVMEADNPLVRSEQYLSGTMYFSILGCPSGISIIGGAFPSAVGPAGIRMTLLGAVQSTLKTMTLYLPGRRPGFIPASFMEKRPLVSLDANPGRPPAVGMNVTAASFNGLPSSVTMPSTGTCPMRPHPTATRKQEHRIKRRMAFIKKASRTAPASLPHRVGFSKSVQAVRQLSRQASGASRSQSVPKETAPIHRTAQNSLRPDALS